MNRLTFPAKKTPAKKDRSQRSLLLLPAISRETHFLLVYSVLLMLKMKRIQTLHRCSLVPTLSLVLLLAAMTLAAILGGASASSTPPVFTAVSSPLKQWEASYAASSAKATVLAMVYEDTILLLHTAPSESGADYNGDPSPRTRRTVTHQGVDCQLLSSTGSGLSLPSWLQKINKNSFLVMTGFSMDAKHLSSCLKQTSEQHNTIFGASMPIAQVVQALAKKLQGVTFTGGRPYGVQALVIGFSDKHKPTIYSLDPSGNWHHFGRGAAIGKWAKPARVNLAKSILGSKEDKEASPPKSLQEAIQKLINSWKETCREQQHRFENDLEPQIVLLWKSPDTFATRLGLVDSKQIQA